MHMKPRLDHCKIKIDTFFCKIHQKIAQPRDDLTKNFLIRKINVVLTSFKEVFPIPTT